MEDREIMKALECCKKSADCKKCPLSEYSLMAVECMGKLIAESEDLVQRQQERIERLKDNLDAVLAERAALDVDEIIERLERVAYETADWMCGGNMKAVELTDAIAIVKGVQNE